MRSITLLFTAALTLAGCATEITPTSEATHIPTNRIYTTSLTQPKNGQEQGQIIVKRDKSRIGVNCTNHLFIDGVHVATIEPSEKIEFYLPLGEHIFSASKPTCGGEIREVTVTPSSTITKILRVWSDRDGNLQIQQTAF